MSYGLDLKLLRMMRERRLSDAELGQAAGLDTSTVSRIANGWKKPTADEKEAIDRALQQFPAKPGGVLGEPERHMPLVTTDRVADRVAEQPTPNQSQKQASRIKECLLWMVERGWTFQGIADAVGCGTPAMFRAASYGVDCLPEEIAERFTMFCKAIPGLVAKR
jgi:transcriptional regulator with XRE-family HTH domain